MELLFQVIPLLFLGSHEKHVSAQLAAEDGIRKDLNRLPMATDPERELAFAPHSSSSLRGICFPPVEELFPGVQHAAASIAQQALLQRTPTSHTLRSASLIPPGVELINTGA